MDKDKPSDEYIKEKYETNYIKLVNDIIKNGANKKDRTGTGVLSLFGEKLKYDISDYSIPLLTTKKMFWRGIIEELLWIIKGSTNSKDLEKNNVNIWKEHSRKKYLDSLDLKTYEEGDLGPLYGFQLRHSGADYNGSLNDYKCEGIDQLKECIKRIKENPNSRRHIISFWNVKGTIDI